jgi:hypothetical protein
MEKFHFLADICPFSIKEMKLIRTSLIFSSITIENKNFNLFLQKGYQNAKTCPLSIERKNKKVWDKSN